MPLLPHRGPAAGPIWLSDDNNQLVISGGAFIFTGKIMKKAIRLLYEAWRNNKPVKLAELLSKSGSGGKDPDSLFGNHWPRLRKHMRIDRGYYRLTAD
jgi:hypothetical protein